MKNYLATSLASACIMLAACGGGGGGGTPSAGTPNSGTPASSVPAASAAAPFQAATFGTVAGPTAATILAAASSADNLAVLSSPDSGQALPRNKQELAKWAMNRYSKSANRVQAVEAIPATACPGGGSLSGSLNDANNNGDFDAGDSLSLSFNACVLEAGQLPVNGSFSIRANSLVYAANGDIANASLTMTFNNFSSYGNTLNGATTIAVNGAAVTTTYSNFTTTRGTGQPTILNYTAALSASGTLSISGLITINNNTYTLSTPTPIVFGSTYPIGGILRVTDAAGARIDIISSNLQGGFVDCDLYLPGDSVRDGRISSAWSAL